MKFTSRSDAGGLPTFSEDEIELMYSLLTITRLGKSKYRRAAFGLLDKLEAMGGTDLVGGAFDAVDPHFSIMDPSSNVPLYEFSGHQVVIEV